MELKIVKTLFFIISVILSLSLNAQSVDGTYSVNDIPTNNSSYSAACNGPSTPLSISLPSGGPWEITSVDVVYDMTAANGAWKSEQRSKIFCQNTSIGESGYSSGSGTSVGTQGYNRTGLTIANGIYPGSSILIFEMQAYRTWAGGGTCNTTYNRIDNNSWTVTINYTTPPTCPDPSTQSASSITSNSADLGWTENGGATLWDLELGVNGFVPTGIPSQTNVTNSYTYTGLSSSTSYDYYVRSNCGGGDYSSWVGPYNFTTTISCPAPSSLSAVNISTSAADLGWTIGGVESQWDIELGQQGFVPTGVPTQLGVTTNPYTYSGLVAGTDYEYYVRAHCGIGDNSFWIGPFAFSTPILTGQVFVSATGGTPSGVYNSIKLAFDAINAGIHTGNITIIVGDADGQTIIETAEAKLNKSGVGGASYSSVNISPGAVGIKIKGAISGSCCITSGVIKLDESENVIIDGRQGGVGTTVDLTIENTNVGSYSSAFIFMAASNNILRYTTLKSAVTGTCCGAGTLGVTDNNIGGGSGSNNNLIEYCNITKSGANVPRRAIFGKGASGRENSNNVIRGCNIFDFEEFGIFLGNSSSSEGYNKDWIIENNSIYQTVESNGMFKNQAGICIGYPYTSGSSGRYERGHFIVRNNTIGGNGAGGDWVWNTTSNYYFFGIFINDGYDASIDHSEIYGNVIHKLDITSGNSSSSSSKPIFGGIVAYNCKVKIGSSGGNIIGSISDLSSIKLSKTASGGYATGIFVSSNSDQKNSINNNTVSGISNTSGTSNLSVFTGIYNASSTTYPEDSIYKNNVSYLTFTNTNYLDGIFAQGFVSKNQVRDFDFNGAASFSELVGISWGGGEIIAGDARGVENNEVILGQNKSGASIATNDVIIGLEIRRGDASVYYNSVLIQGTAGSSDDSYAVELPSSTFTNFTNNLMYNERSGGSGQHYAIYSPHTNSSMWGANNNAYVIGTSANNYIGYWGGDIATLTSWQSASGETNSISDNSNNKPTSVLFPLLGDDSLDVPDPTWLQAGVGTVPSTDIKDLSRDVIPTIGAYEKSVLVSLPVELSDFQGYCDDVIHVSWSTLSESNNSHFIIEVSDDGQYFTEGELVLGKGNSTITNDYSVELENPYEVVYVRLKQVDNNGMYKYSNTRVIECKGNRNENKIFPNPANDQVHITTWNTFKGELSIKIFDCRGRLVKNSVKEVESGFSDFKIDVSDLPEGMYYVSTDNGSKQEINKMQIIHL